MLVVGVSTILDVLGHLAEERLDARLDRLWEVGALRHLVEQAVDRAWTAWTVTAPVKRRVTTRRLTGRGQRGQ